MAAVIAAAPPGAAAFSPATPVAIPDDVIVKSWLLEMPPPGAGLNTVTLAVPAKAISAVEICAVSCVGLTNEVARAEEFQFTCEVEMKFVPVTASVKPARPAAELEGESCVIVGTGLLAGPTVNRAKFERLLPAAVPLVEPGEVTPTGKLPGVARLAVVRAALS